MITAPTCSNENSHFISQNILISVLHKYMHILLAFLPRIIYFSAFPRKGSLFQILYDNSVLERNTESSKNNLLIKGRFSTKAFETLENSSCVYEGVNRLQRNEKYPEQEPPRAIIFTSYSKQM